MSTQESTYVWVTVIYHIKGEQKKSSIKAQTPEIAEAAFRYQNPEAKIITIQIIQNA